MLESTEMIRKKRLEQFIKKLNPEERKKAGNMSWKEMHNQFCRGKNRKLIKSVRNGSDTSGNKIFEKHYACDCGFENNTKTISQNSSFYYTKKG